MGSGMDPMDCHAKAEVATGVWHYCTKSAHDEGEHYVLQLDGAPLTWPAREGDVRRADGLIYWREQAENVLVALHALRPIPPWPAGFPGDANELVVDARRRLRDAYKWLTREDAP